MRSIWKTNGNYLKNEKFIKKNEQWQNKFQKSQNILEVSQWILEVWEKVKTWSPSGPSYHRACMKAIPWKSCILNSKNSRVIYAWSLWISEKVGLFLTNSIKLIVSEWFFETFHITHVRTSQKVKDVIRRNLRHIIVKTKSSAYHCEDEHIGRF